jgi:hypothetical protein
MTTSAETADPGGTAADRDGTATTAVDPDGTMVVDPDGTMAADPDTTTGDPDGTTGKTRTLTLDQ